MLLLLLFSGCGTSNDLASVTGRVTLDGQPTLGLRLRFQPEAPGGSPSYGSTDSDGQYVMNFKRGQSGALIGWHTVRIEWGPGANASNGKSQGQIPARYNKETELRREVKSGVQNVFDFDLKSEGK
jgi:hypothetical protein